MIIRLSRLGRHIILGRVGRGHGRWRRRCRWSISRSLRCRRCGRPRRRIVSLATSGGESERAGGRKDGNESLHRISPMVRGKTLRSNAATVPERGGEHPYQRRTRNASQCAVRQRTEIGATNLPEAVGADGRERWVRSHLPVLATDTYAPQRRGDCRRIGRRRTRDRKLLAAPTTNWAQPRRAT
jgi:hypothetical protein